MTRLLLLCRLWVHLVGRIRLDLPIVRMSTGPFRRGTWRFRIVARRLSSRNRRCLGWFARSTLTVTGLLLARVTCYLLCWRMMTCVTILLLGDAVVCSLRMRCRLRIVTLSRLL